MYTKTSFDEIRMIITFWSLWNKKTRAGRNLPKKQQQQQQKSEQKPVLVKFYDCSFRFLS